jgi:hypothetical protein
MPVTGLVTVAETVTDVWVLRLTVVGVTVRAMAATPGWAGLNWQAPMSLPVTRSWPDWSWPKLTGGAGSWPISAATEGSPAPMAGLPASRAMVKVGPPLLIGAVVARSGLALTGGPPGEQDGTASGSSQQATVCYTGAAGCTCYE